MKKNKDRRTPQNRKAADNGRRDSTMKPREIVSVAALEAEGVTGETARRFCEVLREHSFALLRLPERDAGLLARARLFASTFFEQPAERKTAIGDFRPVGTTYAGYRDHHGCDTEFLEVHVTGVGGTVPTVPYPDGMAEVASALHVRLYELGQLLLTAIASWLQVDPAAFLAPLTPPEASPEDVSATVLRFCHYRAARAPPSDSALEAVDAAPSRLPAREVLFDQHTDSSLLTLSPLCTAGAGLQLMDTCMDTSPDMSHDTSLDTSRDGWPWVDVEETPGLSSSDIEVHVGDFLSFLTGNFFPPCLHRILRPAGGASRISMPLLLRCRQDHILDTRPYLLPGTYLGGGRRHRADSQPCSSGWEAEGAGADGDGSAHGEGDAGGAGGAAAGRPVRLLEVHGVPCGDLGRLFDVRGRRMLEARREREAREIARQGRGRAFRERVRRAQMEGRPLSEGVLSDSEVSELEEEGLLHGARVVGWAGPPMWPSYLLIVSCRRPCSEVVAAAPQGTATFQDNLVSAAA